MSATVPDAPSFDSSDTPNAWEILHFVSRDTRGRRTHHLEASIAIICCNLAAWQDRLETLLTRYRPTSGDMSVRCLPAGALLPGVACALEGYGIRPLTVASGVQPPTRGYAVQQIESTLRIPLRPDRMMLGRISKRFDIPVPNVAAVIGMMMKSLQRPEHSERQLRMCTSAIGWELKAWDASLNVMGLRLDDVLRQLIEPDIPVVEAAPTRVVSPTPPRGSVTRVVCQPSAVTSAISRLTEQKHWHPSLQEFSQDGCTRVLIKAQDRHIEACNQLSSRFPNFSDAINLITQRLTLQKHCRSPIWLPPLLLVGMPGCGKTAFSKALAIAINGDSTLLPLERTSAGFSLSGSHATWKGAAPGEIAQLMLKTQRAARPQIVVLDEVDKCHGGVHPVEPTLLGLLDPSTARNFRDEFFGFDLDVSSLSFIATANNLDSISAPLLSRLQVVHVGAPTPQQMPAIASSVDIGLREEMPELNRGFGPTPTEVYRLAATMPPRLLRRAFVIAYSNAASRSKSHPRRKPALTPQDLEKAAAATHTPQRRPIGFIESQPGNEA